MSMDDMQILREYQSRLVEARVRKEILYDADGSLDAIWIQFKNGRDETFDLAAAQLSDLEAVLGHVGEYLRDLRDIEEDLEAEAELEAEEATRAE